MSGPHITVLLDYGLPKPMQITQKYGYTHQRMDGINARAMVLKSDYIHMNPLSNQLPNTFRFKFENGPAINIITV